MFNWHNPRAKKNTLIGYLSRKYSKEELVNLPANSLLELPDSFENSLYSAELNQILSDSPWKQVKYVANSASSIGSLVGNWKNRWWGAKKTPEESELKIPLKTEEDSKEFTEDEQVNSETASLKSNSSEETIKPIQPETETASIKSESSEDNNSVKDLGESIYYDPEDKSETSSLKSETNQEEIISDHGAWPTFTDQQKQEWLNIGLTLQEADFGAWLKNIKQVTPEWVLNQGDQEQLRSEYQAYLTNPPPKKTWWQKNQPWLIIGGGIVLIILIYNSK